MIDIPFALFLAVAAAAAASDDLTHTYFERFTMPSDFSWQGLYGGNGKVVSSCRPQQSVCLV